MLGFLKWDIKLMVFMWIWIIEVKRVNSGFSGKVVINIVVNLYCRIVKWKVNEGEE